MDIWTFASSLFSSIAWPIAAVVIAILLRKPFSSLLKDVRKLKWNGLEAEFGADLGIAQDLIDQDANVSSRVLTNEVIPKDHRELLLKLAELSPRSVVLEAWREVETAIANALGANTETNKTVAGIRPQKLLDAGLIDDAEYQLLSILKDLRNRAAHERQFFLGKEDAVEYALMANRIVSTLNASVRRKT